MTGERKRNHWRMEGEEERERERRAMDREEEGRNTGRESLAGGRDEDMGE